MATVELVDVRKTYGGVTAVADLSLTVGHGEFVALLGPSGCGKTTTLHLLAGFIPPTSGDIRIDDVSIAGTPPHKRNIGVVFQSYALFPHLSVFDNVAFGLRMRNLPDSDVGVRVRKALDIVHLGQLEERYPRQLSGGQQQRVALARALVIEPSLLLLDEPLSNLDASLREQMRFEIREIQKRIGITTVFVTHDQSEAMAAADRLVVMDQGSIRQAGSVREIYESPADPFVAAFIGQANLLSGALLAVNGTEARMRLANGEEVTARYRDGPEHPGTVTLVLRPEDLSISDAPIEGENSISGTVSRVSFLGSTLNVGVRLGETSVSVLVPRNRPSLLEGQSVFVTWPPSLGLLFAGER